ncbi:MAG TPA: ComF family protein [Terriglobales bacterium]|nr:ComF family protein [Terriglobales bacterium]
MCCTLLCLPRILRKIRLEPTQELRPRRRRFVFSSSTDPTRRPRERTAAQPGVLLSWINIAAESLFATLFPANCRLCSAPLINISRLPVCEECLLEIRPIAGGTCSVCGERIVSPYILAGDGDSKCGLCRRLDPPYTKAVAYGSYSGGLRDLIHLLKYEQVRPAAEVLGRMLAEAIAHLEPLFGDGPVQVIPVPLYIGKFRQRGFNQSGLITKAALKLNSAGGKLVLRDRILERRRETQSQIGLTRHQRRENIRGAFAIAKPEQVAHSEFLLVDDVFTTGTTVSECARVLRRAGASKVWVATVARTLKTETNYAQVDTNDEAPIAVAAAG